MSNIEDQEVNKMVQVQLTEKQYKLLMASLDDHFEQRYDVQEGEDMLPMYRLIIALYNHAIIVP
jgi:hypothetical protein